MFAAAFCLALGVCAGLNLGAFRATAPKMPPPALSLAPETAVETAALLGLGMRRLAADLELVRLLVYYGTSETGNEEQDLATGGGHYPEVGPRTRRIIELDPSFSFAVQYGAGALAFNLNRPDEALDILEFALKRDPDNANYKAYIGAVAFARHGDIRGVVRLLEPMLSSPDCPTMIKSMVAFMYRRLGERRKAVALYLDIAEHSPDAGYRSTAERALRELASQPAERP